jgi:hypothetical protein
MIANGWKCAQHGFRRFYYSPSQPVMRLTEKTIIADPAGSEEVQTAQIAEAIQCRPRRQM